MMKKTNYNSQKKHVKATILGLIFMIFLFFVSANFFYKSLIAIGNQKEKIMPFLSLLISGFFVLFIFINLLMSLIGIINAKKVTFLNNRLIKKSNPYIYYRELPNNYGIGIATLLMDSTIENEKDIVAVILDLCAKGYLNLKKINNTYTLNVLKNIDNNLLENEKYILNLIINNSIKDINYNEWFNYCLQDGINLELFEKKDDRATKVVNNFDKRNEKTQKIQKVYKRTVKTISSLIAIILFCANIKEMSLILTIIYSLAYFIGWSIGLYIILFIPLYWLPVVIVNIFGIGSDSMKQVFNSERLKYIELTPNGTVEVQKLQAFKAFIKDFGLFANKKPEEIVLWEYYLSYAQVFGLTKEILSTGYDKLVKNSSFEIDNIELIELSKINVNMN